MPNLHIAKRPLSALALLTMQIVWAGFRRDLPTLSNQDPSGFFGDPDASQLRIVMLGDSTVTSPGVDPLDSAWPRRLARALCEPYAIDLRSVAVGGSKAKDVLADQVHRALALDPDICVVSVGGNDALRGTPLVQFERDFQEILALLTSRVSHIAVSGIGDLGSIPRLPALARAIARVRARAFDRAIRRVAYPYAQVVKTDTWSPGWDEFNTNPDAIFGGDQFHASAYGHRIYAEAMQPATEELIRRIERDAASELG